jgi:hypothetical protein
VSLAHGSSATTTSSRTSIFRPTGGWRESILVFVMVLAPIGQAAIVLPIGVAAVKLATEWSSLERR